MAKTRALRLTALRTRRDAVLDELAAITAPADGSLPGSLPNSSGPGVHIDHGRHKKGLYEELAELDRLIAALDVGIIEHYQG